jgi:glycosyltransferase involved in cell wall biosynthesis
MGALKAERRIGKALDSNLAQTNQDLDTIVVDDGSTDRTADVMPSNTA